MRKSTSKIVNLMIDFDHKYRIYEKDKGIFIKVDCKKFDGLVINIMKILEPEGKKNEA